MHTLLAVVVAHATLAQAAVTPTLRPDPGPRDVVVGSGIADGTHVLVAKRPTFIDLQGAAAVTLTFHGVVKKRGASPAVVVQVRGAKGGLKTVSLSGPALAGVALPRRPAFALTPPKSIELHVGGGVQTLSVRVVTGAAVAMAISVHAEADDTDEAEAEPSLVTKVGADTIAAEDPSFVVVAPQPPLETLRGPAGDESFFAVDAEHEFLVDASGPGLMSFDFHAHRSQARPVTEGPVVVGVLLDDVLVQTLSIDRPEEPTLSAVGRDYGVSSRATLQLQVPPGKHRVALTLSDDAVLGAGVRPRFEKLPTVRESVGAGDSPAAPEPPPPPPPPPEDRARHELVAVVPLPPPAPAPAPTTSQARLGVLAGAWFPTDAPTTGPMLQLEAVLEPTRLVGMGLSCGLGWARYTASAAPARPGNVDVDIFAVPITGDVRLQAPLGRYAALVVGGGAGARLSWGRTTSDGATSHADVHAKAVAVAHLSLTLGAEGQWLVRGQYMPTLAKGGDQRLFDSGAFTALVGYSF